MPLLLLEGDISKVKADCIVNAANARLLPGGGVCGSIFSAADDPLLERDCKRIGYCPAGSAAVTPAYKLDAQYIIHAVGPMWLGGDHDEEAKLESAYRSALGLAANLKMSSIAFPVLSSGIFGYPYAQALQIALRTITSFLRFKNLLVYLVIYRKTDLPFTQIDFNSIVSAFGTAREARLKNYSWVRSSSSVEKILENKEKTPSELVYDLIRDKQLDEMEICARGNLSHSEYLKIRHERADKLTVFALCFALRLTVEESELLLESMGYDFSRSTIGDVIVRYYLEMGLYDIFEVNKTLFYYNIPQLGA